MDLSVAFRRRKSNQVLTVQLVCDAGECGRQILTKADFGVAAARFLGPDGDPEPTLEACFEDRARLHEGHRGEPVTRVQQALADLGRYDLGTSGPSGDGVDGAYGPKTAGAVRAFKSDEALGFEQIGDVGPGTMGRLDELYSTA